MKVILLSKFRPVDVWNLEVTHRSCVSLARTNIIRNELWNCVALRLFFGGVSGVLQLQLHLRSIRTCSSPFVCLCVCPSFRRKVRNVNKNWNAFRWTNTVRVLFKDSYFISYISIDPSRYTNYTHARKLTERRLRLEACTPPGNTIYTRLVLDGHGRWHPPDPMVPVAK